MSHEPAAQDPPSIAVSTAAEGSQRPSPAAAEPARSTLPSKNEASSRVDADSLGLVTYLLRVLSNESRFYKRYTDPEEGRYYYYDLRTGKSQWHRPPGFVSPEQLASLIHRFFDIHRREISLDFTLDGVPYTAPPAPVELPPKEALMWQGVEASPVSPGTDSKFADVLKQQAPIKEAILARRQSVSTMLMKPMFNGAREGDSKDSVREEKEKRKDHVTENKRASVRFTKEKDKEKEKEKEKDEPKHSPSISKASTPPSRKSGLFGTIGKKDRSSSKHKRESSTARDDPVAAAVLKLKQDDGFRTFTRTFFDNIKVSDAGAVAVLDKLDEDKRIHLVRRVFDHLERAQRDMSFVFSKEVVSRADKYKALNVTHQMHKTFIDSFLKTLVSVVGRTIITADALSSFAFLLHSLSRYMGGPQPTLIKPELYLGEEPTPASASASAPSLSPYTSSSRHVRRASHGRQTSDSSLSEVHLPVVMINDDGSSDRTVRDRSSRQSESDARSDDEPPMIRSLPTLVDSGRSLGTSKSKDGLSESTPLPTSSRSSPPSRENTLTSDRSTSPSPPLNESTPPPSTPPPPPPMMGGVDNPETDGILFSVQFPAIKENPISHHSCAIKSAQGNTHMGYLFLTKSFVCFATKKNKTAIPFSNVSKLARSDTDLIITRSSPDSTVPPIVVVFTNFKEPLPKAFAAVNDLYHKANPNAVTDSEVAGSAFTSGPMLSARSTSTEDPLANTTSPRSTEVTTRSRAISNNSGRPLPLPPPIHK